MALIVQSEPRYKQVAIFILRSMSIVVDKTNFPLQMIANLKELLSVDDIGYEEVIFSTEGDFQSADKGFHVSSLLVSL